MESTPDDPKGKQVVNAQGGIPDFIRLGQMPVNYEMNVESDLLEPVVFNDPPSVGTNVVDGFVRFTLQNKGFLHSESKLFLSLIPSSTTARAVINPCGGIASIIKKCVLKVGNQVLNEISEFSALNQVKSSLISGEVQKEREQFLTGRCMDNEFIYKETGVASTNSRLAGAYGLSNGREYTGGETGLLARPCSVMDSSDADSIAQSPSYQVSLSELFPFLKTHQLPLYMFDEAINIELTFHPATHRVLIPAGGTLGGSYNIDRNEIKFCADYLYFGGGDEMVRYAQQNQDLSFSFHDYRLATSSVNQAQARNIVRNLGMANRLVSRVITIFNGAGGTGQANILGKNQGLGLVKSGTGVISPIEYNIRYNDRFEFSSNVQNTARLFSLLTDSEGVPFITKEQYSGEGAIITGATYEGRAQDTGIARHMFYNSTRLTGGRVGTRGLELHLKATDMDGTLSTMFNFSEYLRVARLRGGFLDVFNV